MVFIRVDEEYKDKDKEMRWDGEEQKRTRRQHPLYSVTNSASAPIYPEHSVNDQKSWKQKRNENDFPATASFYEQVYQEDPSSPLIQS